MRPFRCDFVRASRRPACRGPERGDRVSLARESIRSPAGAGGRLVRRQVAAIAAPVSAGALAAKAATTTIPIVFVVGEDPVRLGLVASLARPGGNRQVSIFSTRSGGKAAGAPARAGARGRSGCRAGRSGQCCNAETTLRDVGRLLAPSDCKSRFSTPAPAARSMRPSPLSCASGPTPSSSRRPFFSSRRAQLILLAARHGVPATYAGREFVETGGLMSYGANLTGCVASGRRLHRPDPQGREASRPAGRCSYKVRTRHQR